MLDNMSITSMLAWSVIPWPCLGCVMAMELLQPGEVSKNLPSLEAVNTVGAAYAYA